MNDPALVALAFLVGAFIAGFITGFRIVCNHLEKNLNPKLKQMIAERLSNN
jgi:uncharacterized protein YneF (UPF0154 family)